MPLWVPSRRTRARLTSSISDVAPACAALPGRFVCPSRIRALWRRALELASRAAGEPLSDWRAAEIVAAEGSSGRPRGSSMGDRVLLEALRLARRDRRRRAAASAAVDVAGSGACPESAESLDGPEPQPFTRAGADTRSDAASSTAPAEQPPTRYDVPAGEPPAPPEPPR